MRYSRPDLQTFAAALLETAGMAPEIAPTVADLLIEGDALGHDTHGLALLPAYLAALDDGSMTPSGDHRVLTDHDAAAVWDGNYLCGVWLTACALDEAAARARRHGVGMVAIRNSHHIACLQVYLQRATAHGLIALITCSDPSNRAVAPFGGVEPVLSPNPMAAGIPAGDHPILIDTSASITTNGLSSRLAAAGQRLPGAWVQDANGNATDDPSVLRQSPPGSLLPTGGLDHGHKGYSLGLLVECLTQGLSGFGRQDNVRRWTASVLVQVIDPARFAGASAFRSQTSHIADICRRSKPRQGVSKVRVPGDATRQRAADAAEHGVHLSDAIVAILSNEAVRRGIAFPEPLARRV